MKRYIIVIILFVLAFGVLLTIPFMLLTPMGNKIITTFHPLPNTIPQSVYVTTAEQDAQKVGISPRFFVAQINLESNFNPRAQSTSGAEGIAQIMPVTAQEWNVDPWNAAAALMAAAQHMAQYDDFYTHDYGKALAAYNAGVQAVNDAIAQATVTYGTAVRWLDYLPLETQHYVHTILNS